MTAANLTPVVHVLVLCDASCVMICGLMLYYWKYKIWDITLTASLLSHLTRVSCCLDDHAFSCFVFLNSSWVQSGTSVLFTITTDTTEQLWLRKHATWNPSFFGCVDSSIKKRKMSFMSSDGDITGQVMWQFSNVTHVPTDDFRQLMYNCEEHKETRMHADLDLLHQNWVRVGWTHMQYGLPSSSRSLCSKALNKNPIVMKTGRKCDYWGYTFLLLDCFM